LGRGRSRIAKVLLVALVALGGGSCTKESDCLIVVTLKASKPISRIRDFKVTLRVATEAGQGRADTLLFSSAAPGWTLSELVAETVTLGVEIGASVAPVVMTVEALDVMGMPVGKAERRTPVEPKSNYIWRVTMTLDPVAAPPLPGDGPADASSGDDAVTATEADAGP
jgi:hypothetical protein